MGWVGLQAKTSVEVLVTRQPKPAQQFWAQSTLVFAAPGSTLRLAAAPTVPAPQLKLRGARGAGPLLKLLPAAPAPQTKTASCVARSACPAKPQDSLKIAA